MFSIDNNEYVLENVAKTIKYECFRRGFDYKEDEIKYLAVQEISNPRGEFAGTHSNLERDINYLMDLCIDFLCEDENTFSIKTIIIQSYYLQWYKCKEAVAENYRKLIKDHTNPLVVDICRTDPRDGQEYQNLYRKIVLAMLLLSGVGDATKKDYILAAEVALKSIFPQKNLEGFIHLSYHNKITELDDLKKTVTGIILYNEYKLNQSVTSNQQSTLLEEGSKVILEKLSHLAFCLDSLAAVITLSIQEIVHFDAVDQTLIVIESSPFIDNNNSGHTVKSYLLLLQQCRRFVRTLLEDARDCQQDFYRQEDDYQYHIRSLMNDLRGKVAISMYKVYSKFQEIGGIWERQQELCVIFNSINDTQSAVLTLSEVHRMPDCLKKLTGCDGLEPVDIEELASQVTTRIETSYFYNRIDSSMVLGEVVDLIDESPEKLEFNGFCPVYCVESNGFLIDARKEIGVILFEGKFYGFRDAQAAHVFGKDPKKYIEKVIEFVRCNVEYIETLGLTQQVIPCRGTPLYFNVRGLVKTKKPVRDKEIQTDTHPEESFIDKDYSWNLWEYKRRAIKLADIVKRTTKSSQSYSSHFREAANAQTYSPREVPSQTMKESSANTINMPAETWRLRGGEPHIRLISAECLPGQKPNVLIANPNCTE